VTKPGQYRLGKMSKAEVGVDQENFLISSAKDRLGRLFRYGIHAKVEQLDNVWVRRRERKKKGTNAAATASAGGKLRLISSNSFILGKI